MSPEQILKLYMVVWLALIGAVMGSFFACAVDRGGMPKRRSHCNHCGHVLGIRDLVPVLSYLLGRGRCRYCGEKISVRCLVVELLTAALFAALGFRFGFGLELVMQLILASILLLLSLIDWDTYTLPDGLLVAAIVNRLVFLFVLHQPLKEMLIAMAIGALSASLPLLGLSLLMDHVLKKESMGGGDIKLLFVLGLYLNWIQMLLLLMVGCVLALAWAVKPRKDRAQAEIPFGPFLSAAWCIVILFGTSWIQWYQGLLA